MRKGYYPYFKEGKDMKIKTENLSVSFEKTVLENLNLEIAENTAIMGESGSGKTTFLNAVSGLVKPDSGKISFSKKPRISFVFQENRLFENYSALDNVKAVAPKEVTEKEISDLLESLGIEKEDQQKAVSTFSGGMKRRVAISRALVYKSNLLLLDEPFKGLDEKTREECANVIKNTAKEKLIVLVTHQKEEAELLGIKKIIELK
jgi:ABC-type multidrug transport system ATPase subunit